MLEDLEEIKRIDESNILEIFLNFPENIENALEIARSSELDQDLLDSSKISNIVITGMGGSAIGGALLSSWLWDRLEIPIIINRDYTLPAFANENTLLIGATYSGNTRETLEAVTEGLKQNCRIICITSGGKLERFCNDNKLSIITVPSGMPPRAAIAYLLFPLIAILEKLELIEVQEELIETIATLRELREDLKPEVTNENNTAKQLALDIKDTFPMVFAYGFLIPIAQRWKTQFNENSKIIAGFGAFPESSHNDIVGWAGDEKYITQQFTVIYLRTDREPSKVSDQIEYTMKLQESKVNKIIELKAPRGSRLMQMMYLMYIGDLVSLYLAILRGKDPTPIEAIDNLKEAMK